MSQTVNLQVEMPEPQPFTLDPAKTAVVVVDMQNFFLRGEERARMAPTIEGTVELLRKAREAGAKVIYIQTERTTETLDVARFGREPRLFKDTYDWEIAEEVAPLPGEPIVLKESYDPWARTKLEDVLAAEGIDAADWNIIVPGVSAAVCAHACALGFSNRWYMTLIPLDGTAAGTLEEEARVYAQYLSDTYNWKIAFTSSELVTFEPGAPAAELQLKQLASV
jgi:nicotinamidase-related amidase